MANLLDRNFVDLDTKRQIEFNRQKNVQQDQRLKTNEGRINGLQAQIDLANTGRVTAFLPLVWARVPGVATWRTEFVISGDLPDGLYQLVPGNTSTTDYISTLVQVVSNTFTILLAGDYVDQQTLLDAYSVDSGSLVGSITVSQSEQQSSNLDDYNPNENQRVRVKVMKDLDNNQREYVSIDVTGAGLYAWIRYGTLLNGVNGRNIFRVTAASISDVKAVAQENDVLLSLENFSDGSVSFHLGDVGLYLPFNTPYFTPDGNIAIKGDTGDEGAQGIQGFNGTAFVGFSPVNYAGGFPSFNAVVTLNPALFQVQPSDPIPLSGQPVFWTGFINNINQPSNQALLIGMVTNSTPTALTVSVRAVMSFAGTQGSPGLNGADGRSIVSIVPTRTGTTTTIMITMSDNATTTFQVEDGESALPFVIAQGVFTISTLPSFASAADNTAYVVLNTSPPTNTYDLYIKAGNNTNWTIVTSWGGVQGDPGAVGLTYNLILAVNNTTLTVPSSVSAVVASFNRAPIVGDTALLVIRVTNTTNSQTVSAMATGTIASISGSNATVTITGSTIIPNGVDGTSMYQINFGTVTTAPADLSAYPYTLAQLQGGQNPTTMATGTQVLVSLQVLVAGQTRRNYIGYATIVTAATSTNSGTLDMTSTPSFTDGINGTNGTDGNGILSVSLFQTVGLVKTYRITYTNGTTFDFKVTDGADTPAPVTVGVVWDGTATSPNLTRLTVTNDPNGFVNQNIVVEPVPSIAGSVGSSPFDAIAPWSGMQIFQANAAGDTFSSRSLPITNTAEDLVVRIPAYWFKIVKIGARVHYYISAGARPGFKQHKGSNCHVARYATTGTITAPTTRGTGLHVVSQTRAAFRTASAAKGARWWQWDFHTWSAINLLYLVEYASFDSQAKIGQGVTAVSAQVQAGGTNAMTYHTGRPAGTDAATPIHYRNIENFWGNIYQWVDGCNTNERRVFISDFPPLFADDIVDSGYVDTGMVLPASNYIRALMNSDDENWVIPMSSAGAAGQYVPDRMYSNTGFRVLAVGGAWIHTDYAGAFFFTCDSTSANTNTVIGSRLVVK